MIRAHSSSRIRVAGASVCLIGYIILARKKDSLPLIGVSIASRALSHFRKSDEFGLRGANALSVITSKQEGGFYAVTQLEHSALVGIIASNWGGGAIAMPNPRRPMLVMAAEHDLCWVYHDHRPQIDSATGVPYDYATLPYKDHVHLYREGARYLAEREPYGGYMLSLHGTGIYNGRHGTDAEMVRPLRSNEEASAVETYLQDGECFRESLRAQILATAGEDTVGFDNNTLWTNYHLMQVWDRLGLLFSKGVSEDFTIDPVPMAEPNSTGRIQFAYQGNGIFRAAPYPFSSPNLSLSVRSRKLPKEKFDSNKDYHAALDNAPYVVFNFQIRSA